MSLFACAYLLAGFSGGMFSRTQTSPTVSLVTKAMSLPLGLSARLIMYVRAAGILRRSGFDGQFPHFLAAYPSNQGVNTKCFSRPRTNR